MNVGDISVHEDSDIVRLPKRGFVLVAQSGDGVAELPERGRDLIGIELRRRKTEKWPKPLIIEEWPEVEDWLSPPIVGVQVGSGYRPATVSNPGASFKIYLAEGCTEAGPVIRGPAKETQPRIVERVVWQT